jgi:hypothetical protein
MDPFIEAEEAQGHSVKHCCELFEVSRAAYYQRKSPVPSPRELSDAELLAKIREVHAGSDGTYGAPRVHHELRHQGVTCGRRRVRRLMRQHGIEGRCKKRSRKTTIPDPAAQAEALDLVQRHFGPSEVLDARYVGDITYIATWEGWAYLLVTWNHQAAVRVAGSTKWLAEAVHNVDDARGKSGRSSLVTSALPSGCRFGLTSDGPRGRSMLTPEGSPSTWRCVSATRSTHSPPTGHT